MTRLCQKFHNLPLLVFLLLHALALFSCGVRPIFADDTITLTPSAEQLRNEKETERINQRLEQHQKDLHDGKQYAYIAVLRGKDFGHDWSRLSVRINSVRVNDALLHNSTTISFRIPNHMALNKELLSNSLLQVDIGDEHHKNIPLIVLERVIVKVDFKDYREKVERQHNGEVQDIDVVPITSLDTTQNAFSEVPANGQAELHTSAEDRTTDDNTVLGQSDEHISTGGVKANGGGKHSEDTIRDSDPNAEQLHPNAAAALVLEAEKLISQSKLASSREAVKLLNEAIGLGNIQAMTTLASLLLSGTTVGIMRNIEEAVDHLQAASRKGYPDAQALLGFLYASGIAGTALRKDIGAAVVMWTFAAEGGSAYAKMALGFRYFTGTDIPEDCEKAAEYYKDVADSVFEGANEPFNRDSSADHGRNSEVGDYKAEIRPPTPHAMLASDRKRLHEHMRRQILGESNDVIQYYRHAADRGDPAAQVMMGNLYYYGDADMPQDRERARELFVQAARLGKAEAHAHLGLMDLRAGRNESAAQHLLIAANREDKFGLHGMGYMAFHGIGMPRDEQRAAKYFAKAAELDYSDAMFNLAIMYSKGIGVAHSPHHAYRWFQNAAKFGHLQGSYNVGVMMMKGVPPARKQCSLATHFLKVVAEQGPWNKIFSLALRAHERGAYADALYRYLEAAHAGIEVAQFNAAFMYTHNTLSNADGMKLKYLGLRDSSPVSSAPERSAVVEEALELYQMSASQGNSDSMVRLGDLAFGEGNDYSRAAMSYERAVRLRNAEAMFNLGWMHARGLGMTADKHMAKRYFDQAKEADRDAIIPATIAVYSLSYGESLFAVINRCSTIWGRIRTSFATGHEKWPDASEGRSAIAISDSLALSILLGVLIFVVNARHRRLVAAARAPTPDSSDVGGANDGSAMQGNDQNARGAGGEQHIAQ